MDSDKIKRTFYLTPEANTKLNHYITYCASATGDSTYGYSSRVTSNALMNYCYVPEDWDGWNTSPPPEMVIKNDQE